MLKHFSILVVLMITACDGQKESNKNLSRPWDSTEKAMIVSDFKMFDAAHLSPLDSCMTLHYLTADYSTLDQNEFQVFNGMRIFSERCWATNFSFTILQKDGDGRNSELYYYGMSDIYNLKYNEQFEREKLLEFENDGLEQLINKLAIVDPALSKRENLDKVRMLLFFIYHEKMDRVSAPLFETSGLSLLLREYADKIDKKLLEEFTNGLDGDFIVFENMYMGMVAFKISFRENQIELEEFLVPGKEKRKFFKPDILTDDYWLPCRSCSFEVGRN